MARTSNEVVAATGTLYWAPEGTAFPATPTTAVGSAWTDIGYSEAGWSLHQSRSTADIEVAESIDPLDVVATGSDARLVGVAVQTSLANLRVALGGGTISTATPSSGFSTYVPPTTGSLTKFAFLLRVQGPGSSKTRDIQMPHGIPIGAVELAYKKAPDKSQINLEARLVRVDPDQPYTIIDQV